MEVEFKNGEIISCSVSNPVELNYLKSIMFRSDLTGTLNFEFTDPRDEALNDLCMERFEMLENEGEDPAKDGNFILLVRELSKLRVPHAYYGPEEFNGLHHDGKAMYYLPADFHARALAEVVGNGQLDNDEILYDAFVKSVEAYQEYVDDCCAAMFGCRDN
mgnify:FL=1